VRWLTADRGYHGAAALELCPSLGMRRFIAEPKRRRRWHDKSPAHHRAVLANRRRMRRVKGRRLQRLRSERVERSFAHVCDIGGARRSWIRGLVEVTKRYLITVAAHNLGRILRKLFGAGKPRGMRGCECLLVLVQTFVELLSTLWLQWLRRSLSIHRPIAPLAV
jgi:transposase